MDNSSLFSCLPRSFPFSHLCFCLPPLPFRLHLLRCAAHTTEDEAGLHTCLWESPPTAETHREREREREGERKKERRGGAVLVDVSSDIKRRGEGNGLDVITQGCCCRQEWRGVGGGLLRRTSKAACQTKQWLPPCIAVQSIAKQIISSVQHRTGSRGRHAQL